MPQYILKFGPYIVLPHNCYQSRPAGDLSEVWATIEERGFGLTALGGPLACGSTASCGLTVAGVRQTRTKRQTRTLSGGRSRYLAGGVEAGGLLGVAAGVALASSRGWPIGMAGTRALQRSSAIRLPFVVTTRSGCHLR
jgi:hypothetical protein